MSWERAISPRALVAGGVIAYVALFNLTYVHFVGDVFTDQGYGYARPGFGVWAVLLVFSVFPAIWLPTRLGRVSGVAEWILYLVVFVPSMTVPLYAVGAATADQLQLATVLGLALAVFPLARRVPLLRLPQVSLSPRSFIGLLGAMSVVTVTVMVWKLNFSFSLADIGAVYDVRADYADAVGEAGRAVAYLVGWQANVINPALVVWGLHTRRWYLVTVGLGLQYLVFAATGLKGAVALLAVVLGLYVLLRSWRTPLGTAMAWGSSGALGAVTLAHITTSGPVATAGSSWILSLLFRRALATPGLMTGLYFDFFSGRPKANLDHSILGPFVETPYVDPPPVLIGTTYFPDSSPWANGNLWADGFANFGFVGIIAMTVLLVFGLYLADSFLRGRSLVVPALLLVAPLLPLVNTGLLTSLVTHGLALGVIVMILAPVTRDSPG
ncbi:MAG: hypothetical protein HKN93_02460 [Acidimicrobiia bacterium]|nr:hypothetical protein [Acidimicrobiia bacterium]